MTTSPPLVVTTAGLVDIGGGELVWTRVYTAHDARRPSPPPPPPQQQQQQRARQQQQRRARAPTNADALSALVRSQNAAILLLHGFPDTGDLWARLGPELARATNAAVIAPDLPGAGLSAEAVRAGASCPEDVAAYGVGSLARRMLALLSALFGDDRAACVAGHDFGAAIAWRMAMAAPARVRRLAALSVGHPAAIAAGGARQRGRFWYYLYISLSPPSEAERALARDDWALFRQVMRPEAARGGGGGANDAAVDACVARLSSSPKLLRAATNLYRANYRAEAFGATAVPQPVKGATALGGGGGALEAVLGIVGRNDPALTVEQMAASGAFVLPPATWSCEVWPDAGHWMMREEPERLARALARFFAPACGPPASGGGRSRRGLEETGGGAPRARL